LQTLSLAGVPWYFDNTRKAYRVRPGFKFPGLEQAPTPSPDTSDLKSIITQLIAEGETFLCSLREIEERL